VNVHEKKIYNCLKLQQVNSIDKTQWESFWHIFNLFQSDTFVRVENGDVEDIQDETDLFTTIKNLYSNTLHDLIQQSIAKGWVTKDSAEYLDSWMDEHGNVLADAALVLSVPKIAVEPHSDESRSIFEKAGFSIYSENELSSIQL